MPDRRETSLPFDAVIVGAGPAGSTAARVLSQHGMKVLLLDKCEFPRNRPCGGVVSEKALSFLDFPLPASLIEREIYGSCVRYKSRSTSAHRQQRLASVTSRLALDHFLLEKAIEAGATFKSLRVTGLEQDAKRASVHTSDGQYSARFVIGADGPASVVARSIGCPRSKHEMSVTHEFDVDHALPVSPSFRQDTIHVHFGVGDRGYGWVLPHKGYWNIGVWGRATRVGKVKHLHNEFCDSLPSDRLSGGEPRNELTWIIPGGADKDRLGRGRVFLIGDAAGLTDFFFGEGIPYAIRSGALAATAIAGNASPKVALNTYRTDCNRQICRQLRLSRVMGEALHRRPNLLLPLFTHQQVLEQYLDVGAGYSSYGRFFAWLIPRMPALVLKSLRGGTGSGAGLAEGSSSC